MYIHALIIFKAWTCADATLILIFVLFYRRWRKNKKDISVLPEPPFLSIGSPLLQIRPRRPPVGTADENDRAGGQGPL